MKQAAGSFRDPCGQVLVENGQIIRTINECYQEHWQMAQNSGLLQNLVESGFMPAFEETKHSNGAWKTLEVQKIPFISYPYEWSFSQLQDAALLTLRIQKRALRAGMVLKDASAFNIKFQNGKPLFIDLLSFEKRLDNSPWQGYRQFCKHFLASLALYARDNRLGRLSSLWIDGVGLDLAWNLLGAGKILSS